MRLKAIALILLGIVLALATGVATFQYTRALETELTSARASLRAFGETATVPVLKVDAAQGAVLKASDFRPVKLPLSYVPPNVILELPTEAGAEGFVALTNISAGALVLRSEVAQTAKESDFGFLLSPDSRAFAVAPRNLADFADRLQPGDMVDLIWTRDIGGGTTETRLIGSSLRILAVPASGTESAGAAGGTMPSPLAGKLILEGLAVEALRYIQAEQSGFFHILPTQGRLDEDVAELAIGPTDLKSLPLVVRESEGGIDPVGIVERITGSEPQRKVCATAVIRAGTRSIIEVPC
jgi:Flp pilus assembly protein CpaB